MSYLRLNKIETNLLKKMLTSSKVPSVQVKHNNGEKDGGGGGVRVGRC